MMGGAIYRTGVLLIGGLILLVSGIVAGMVYLRPAPTASYTTTEPLPVHVATVPPVLVQPTVLPPTPVPRVPPTVPSGGTAVFGALSSPMLLLAGAGLLLLIGIGWRLMRQRRMPYVNQTLHQIMAMGETLPADEQPDTISGHADEQTGHEQDARPAVDDAPVGRDDLLPDLSDLLPPSPPDREDGDHATDVPVPAVPACSETDADDLPAVPACSETDDQRPSVLADAPVPSDVLQTFFDHGAIALTPPIPASVDSPQSEPHSASVDCPQSDHTLFLTGDRMTTDTQTILSTVLQALTTDPRIVAGAQPGVSPKRVRVLLPTPWKPHTSTLLAWFDAAGILEPPRDANQPWRTPRPLRETDVASIAKALAQTPVPILQGEPS